MKLEQIQQFLEGDIKTSTFISENFENVDFIGAGPASKVFKGTSTRFFPQRYQYALRVILSTSSYSDAELVNLFEQRDNFVKTLDVIRLHTSIVQIKEFYSTNLQTFVPVYQNQKQLDALITALKNLSASLTENGIEHRNLKCTNIFVEYGSTFQPKLVVSDGVYINKNEQQNNVISNIKELGIERRNFQGKKGTDDNKALANIIHQLVSGVQFVYLASGKPLFHDKAKNGPYFRHIKQFLEGKKKIKKSHMTLNNDESCPAFTEKFVNFKSFYTQLENPIQLAQNALKYGPLPAINHVIYAQNITCVVSETAESRKLQMDVFQGNKMLSKYQTQLGICQLSVCVGAVKSKFDSKIQQQICWVQDSTYLYCWGDSFIGQLPWQAKYGVKSINGFQMSEDLCRILITEQKRTCVVLEVHRLPQDSTVDTSNKGRLREDFYQLNLDQMEDDLKASILASQLIDGSVAFIATDQGLVRWKFLLSNEQEPYETFFVGKSKQIECVMTNKHATFYKWDTQEFVIVDFAQFTAIHQIRIPGSKIDKLAVVELPFSDEAPYGFKIIGLDWVKDRQLVMIDLATMSRTVLDIPLQGWIEAIVGQPEYKSALIVYKHELVQIKF